MIEQDKVNTKSRLAYAGTDAAGNLLYCVISGYLLYYYTDVFGLSVGVAGTILFIARFIDACDAPLWGVIIDRTKSKFGKSRPWFLWLCLPFAVFTTLTFTCPDLDGSLKVLYAFITYVLAGFFYTGIATPITSILPNLTKNSNERIVLNSYRMIGGNIGYVIAVTFTLPLVAFLGDGDDKLGFSLTLAIFSLIAVPLFIYAFKNLKENNVEAAISVPVKESFKAVKGNWPWMIIVAANLLYWIGNTVRGSTLVYYFEYNLGMKDYIPLINAISLIQVLGVIAIPFLVRRANKGKIMIAGLIVAAIGQLLMHFAGSNIMFIIAGWLIACIGTGIAVSMPFAMLSDTVDFGEWRSGIRSAGFLTAIGSSLCIKFGSGIGAFISSMIMGASGYIANTEQSAESLWAINFNFVWLPMLIWVASAIVMLMYDKYERNESTVLADLELRQV